MKSLKLLLLLTAGLFILTSCKDKNDISNLPPATEVGANTFGCLINGKIFKSNGYLSMFSMSGISVFRTDYDSIMYIQVQDFNYDNNKTKLNILFKCEKRIGIYKDFVRINGYFPISNSKSFVNISRFDDIISGTFEFEGINEQGELISITNGRFDYDSKNKPL